MNALSGRVATQARQQSGGSIRFPDNASRIRYMQGQISVQQRQAIAPIPPTRPDPPTNVIGTRGSGQVSVAFQAPTFNGDSPILVYTVYAFPGGATATGSSSPIIVSGLENGTAYTFTVKAHNAIGISAASAPSAPIIPAGLPDAPTNVVAARDNRSVSVSFDPPTNTGGEDIDLYTATLYKLSDNTDIGSSGGFGSPITIDSMAAPTITNGTQYYVKVSAQTVVGTTESAASNTVIPATTPAAPIGLVATAGNGYISIAFTAGNDGGSAISMYQYSLNGGSYTILSPADTSSPIVITGLTNGTPYTIRLKAVNDVGAGTASDPTSATPFLPITTPAAPTNLVAQTINPTSVIISFTAGANGGSAITNYEYSINDGATFVALSPADTSIPITISGLTASTTYSIKLRAVNVVGSGTESASLSVTTNAPVGLVAPTLTYALPDDGSAYIYFNAGNTNGDTLTNYEYAIDGGEYSPVAPADTNSPVKILGLQNGTSYSITLRAISSSATSPDSNTISVLPSTAVSRTANLQYDISSGAGSYSGSGTTVLNIGSAGTVSGQINGAVAYTSGIRGGVFDFNGGRIAFPQTDFGSIFTVSAWIKPTSKTSINGLIANIGANQAPRGFKLGWNSWTTTNRVMLYEGGNGTSGNARGSLSPEIEFGVWQHLTYIVDTVENRVLFFKNGLPVDITNTSIVDGVGTNQSFCIGAFTDGSYSMDAQLSSIKVYTEILTAADVLTQFNATKTRFSTPTAPTNLNNDSILSDGTGFSFRATISFTAPSDIGASVITNYKYSLDNGSTYTELNPEDVDSPITINQLQPSTTYNVKIRAVNVYGDGVESEILTFITPPPQLGG